MMKNNIKLFLSIGLIIFLFGIGCKEPYNADLRYTQTNFLVVEGYIDGAAVTQVRISRTRELSKGDTAKKVYETSAKVMVEDDAGKSFFLYDYGQGLYSSADVLNLSAGRKYRLNITTNNGEKYLSDFVDFKSSPPIDKIGWKKKNGDVEIVVSTQDPKNETKYYRWEYQETWEYHSYYTSIFKYDEAAVKVVDRDEQVKICWRDGFQNSIQIDNSTKLNADIISEKALLTIPNHSDKLSVLYSINVKQFALDVNAYNFWEAMKSNTEQLGSIFDPQPNQTQGNIHSLSNPGEPVVGYISAGNSYTKRAFVKNTELEKGWNIPDDCPQFIVEDVRDSLLAYFYYSGLIPINQAVTDKGRPAYTGSSPNCVDCTIKGTNVKPYFWPN